MGRNSCPSLLTPDPETKDCMTKKSILIRAYYNSAFFIFMKEQLSDSTELTSVEVVENCCTLYI